MQTITKPDELTFDAATHVYRFRGAVIPSVTQILSGLGWIDTRWYTPESRERGTNAHLCCDFLDRGDYDQAEAAAFGVDGYVESWRKLRAKLGAEVVDIERLLADPLYLYGGKPDRLLRINGRLWVADFKTGGAEKWHKRQTGGYARLYRANGITEPLRRMAIYLKADGAVAENVEHDDQNDVSAFPSYVITYRDRRNDGNH